jgi:hypothetical protein
MPVINGGHGRRRDVEAVRRYGRRFVTAFDEYALKAFEMNAFDYILKPVPGPGRPDRPWGAGTAAAAPAGQRQEITG